MTKPHFAQENRHRNKIFIQFYEKDIQYENFFIFKEISLYVNIYNLKKKLFCLFP